MAVHHFHRLAAATSDTGQRIVRDNHRQTRFFREQSIDIAQQRAADLARFRMALTSAWQTADSSPVRPGVEDEREHVGFYLTEVLYRVMPVFYETLDHAIGEYFGIATDLPRLVRVLEAR